MRFKYLYFLISAFFLVPGIISLFIWGLKPSIDFTGGTVLEISNEKFPARNAFPIYRDAGGKIKELIEKDNNVKLNSIQETGQNSYILKLNNIDKNKKEEIINVLTKEFGNINEERFETVGPVIGKELIKKTIAAIILAAGFILLYIGRQFKEKKYGVCAILAMFHDTVILLGIFSLLGHFLNVEVDTLFVTAMLTILSFSVHDTVVVYDRIRESLKYYSNTSFEQLANKAVTETLSRSINNSMTIIFMLLCLYLYGGQTIQWFAFALLVGTISGTYSSTFTAVPLLVVWNKIEEKRKK